MKKETKSAKAAFYFAAIFTTALLSALTILAEGSAGTRTVLFGLTIQRLALFLIPSAAAAAALIFLIRAVSGKGTLSIFAAAESLNRAAFEIHFTLLIFFFSALLVPSARVGEAAAIYERLKPIFFLFCGWGLAGVMTFSRSSFAAFLIRWIDPVSKKTFAGFLSVLTLFIASVYLSGIGITPGNESWYESAIPILPAQLWAAALTVYYSTRLLASPPFPERIKKIPKPCVFLLIWALAALAFCALPMKDHFFAPGPYPPDNRFYPYSDAIFTDFEARTAANGFGFNFGGTVQKPFATYLTFLIQTLAGFDTNRLQLVQSAVFAIAPALLYLFASELAGWRAGIFSAVFFVFQELNAQRSFSILTIHSRLQMSEWIAEILMILFAYLLYRSLKDQGKQNVLSAAAAGTVLGAAIYTRFNFFAFLPAAIVLIFVSFYKKPAYAIKTALTLTLALCATAAPWIYRSYQNTGEFLPEIFGSFQTVIIDQRLNPILETDAAREADNQTTSEPRTPPDYRKSASADKAPGIRTAAYAQRPNAFPSAPAAKTRKDPENGFALIVRTIANHTFHNLYALFFIAPTTLEFNDLESTFSLIPSPWQQRWIGRLSIENIFCLIMNLILTAWAFAKMIQNDGFAGIAPLYWALVYAAALGLARTSGGRYLVPMNWIGCLVFSIGLSSIFDALPVRGNLRKKFTRIEIKPIFNRAFCHKKCGERMRTALILGIAVFFGSSFWTMTLIERKAAPEPIGKVDPATLRKIDPLIDWDSLLELTAANQIYELNGTVLYPRFYYFQAGEKGSDLVYQIRPYSRLVFRLLQSDQATDILLPTRMIPEDFHAGDTATVYGCREIGQHYMDALLVVKRNGAAAETVYRREPSVEFSCPTREPLCPATDECY